MFGHTAQTHYLDFDKVELWFKSYVHYHKRGGRGKRVACCPCGFLPSISVGAETPRFGLDVSTADEKQSIPYPQRPDLDNFPSHGLNGLNPSVKFAVRKDHARFPTLSDV